MTEKVITINTQPGIRRDGTTLDGDQYSDGLWVRFQRGRPRKMAGYRRISNQIYGPTRGMFVDSANGINNIFTSYASGLQVIGVDNSGVGSGVSNFTFTGPVATLGTIVPGAGYTNGTYNDVALTGGTGTGAKANIVVAGGFNDWSTASAKMKRVGNEWVVETEAEPGKHLYKFVVDGQWILDPANKQTAWENGYENSVVQIK